jgi:hypothetical protein
MCQFGKFQAKSGLFWPNSPEFRSQLSDFFHIFNEDFFCFERQSKTSDPSLYLVPIGIHYLTEKLIYWENLALMTLLHFFVE